ncbi:hypothetical protein ACVGWA_00345, partial [Enterobacter hormaechei]
PPPPRSFFYCSGDQVYIKFYQWLGWLFFLYYTFFIFFLYNKRRILLFIMAVCAGGGGLGAGVRVWETGGAGGGFSSITTIGIMFGQNMHPDSDLVFSDLY